MGAHQFIVISKVCVISFYKRKKEEKNVRTQVRSDVNSHFMHIFEHIC